MKIYVKSNSDGRKDFLHRYQEYNPRGESKQNVKKVLDAMQWSKPTKLIGVSDGWSLRWFCGFTGRWRDDYGLREMLRFPYGSEEGEFISSQEADAKALELIDEIYNKTGIQCKFDKRYGNIIVPFG